MTSLSTFWKWVDSRALSLFRSFAHFLTGVCAIIGGVFTGEGGWGWWGMVLWDAAALMWFFSCSGWPDRFPHLPLCQSHPEEDRAGQGVLTERRRGVGRLYQGLVPLQTLERNLGTLLGFLYFTEYKLPKGMNLNHRAFFKLLWTGKNLFLVTVWTLLLRS